MSPSVDVRWINGSGRTPDRAVLGSSPNWGHCVVLLGKHFPLTVPLSPQDHKWVSTNLVVGVIQGGVEILML